MTNKRRRFTNETLDYDAWLINSYPGIDDDDCRGYWHDMPAVIDFTGRADVDDVRYAVVLAAVNPEKFAPIDGILPHFREFMTEDALDGGWEDDSTLRMESDTGMSEDLDTDDLYIMQKDDKAIDEYVELFRTGIEDGIYADFLKSMDVEPPDTDDCLRRLAEVADFLKSLAAGKAGFLDLFYVKAGKQFKWDFDRYFRVYEDEGPDY